MSKLLEVAERQALAAGEYLWTRYGQTDDGLYYWVQAYKEACEWASPKDETDAT